MSDVAWFIHALDTPRGHEIVQEFCDLAVESEFIVEPFITWAQPGEFEEVTLNKLRECSIDNPGAKVLYTHTKGAYTVHLINEVWRVTMATRLITPWHVRLADLEEVDAVGLHWLTPGMTDQSGTRVAKHSFFGGNFWWARADYLATLPLLPTLTAATRYRAEHWIGRGKPKVKDLSPGWPAY